jgi:regulator of RNase E activity RraA
MAGLFVVAVWPASGQAISRDQLIFYTSEWDGERFPDGRPRVPDDVLDRMRIVSTEQAWAVLRGEGYVNQFEGGWKIIHPNQPIVGRALTAQYVPSRPELQQRMTEAGHAAGRIGPMNSWPIDMLETGDVYVADGFGKVADGTLIGDNLGNAIYARSGNGVVFDGSARDLEGLREIEGFNAFVRDWHPSFIQHMMLLGVNTPVRIGSATVLPGDIVLAREEGVVFIPPHLARKVVETAEVVILRDRFGHQRLREGAYTPGQIDTRWSDAIESDFARWLEENKQSLPVPASRVEELLRTRTW